MERPTMRKRGYCWKKDTSRYVSWLHKEGYTDAWNPLRWISREDIELCSEDKTARPHAYVARRNAPYCGGYPIWEPGHYRVELEIIKGIHGMVGFLSEKCADGFPDDRRHRLKKRFEEYMFRQRDIAEKKLLATYNEWLKREWEREEDDLRKELFMRGHKFHYDTEQFCQSIAMTESVTRGKEDE